MTDEPHIDGPCVATGSGAGQRRDRPLIRLPVAVLAGAIAGLLMWQAIQRGAEVEFAGETPEEMWTALEWGRHFIVRSLASLLSALVASFVAGVIARRAGGVIAFVATAPAAIVWACVAVFGWTELGFSLGLHIDDTANMGRRVAAAVLALVIPVLAFLVGRAAARVGDENASHFDARRRTLLGIRWYHYLWLPFVLHFAVTQTFWVILHYWKFVIAAWISNSLLAFVPALLCIGLLASLQITVHGFGRAYGLLAGFASSSRARRDVFKFGCGLPLLGLLVQLAIGALLFAFAWLLQVVSK